MKTAIVHGLFRNSSPPRGRLAHGAYLFAEGRAAKRAAHREVADAGDSSVHVLRRALCAKRDARRRTPSPFRTPSQCDRLCPPAAMETSGNSQPAMTHDCGQN